MPSVDPALIARAEAQLASDPRVQRLMAQTRGSRVGAGAVDPKQFGIDYLPNGYVLSLGNGKVVQDWGVADKVMTAIALSGMGLGIGAGIAGGPAAAASGGSGAGAASQAATGGLLPQLAPGAASAALTGVTPGLGLGNTGNLNPVGSVTANVVDAVSNGGSGIADKIKSALSSPDGLASLAGIIGGLAAGGFGGGGNGASDEQMNALLEQARLRTERTDPLHQAVTQLAFSRLPVSARNGIQLTGK
jgi:hypothetical protein